MGQYNLNRIFRPAHIAVVGASERPGSIGNAVMANLLAGSFPGTIHPVNPKHRRIHGLDALKSVAAVGGPVDLAVIATPMETVDDIVAQCAGCRFGGAVILSAGGKEIGEKGRRIEAAIRRTAYEGKLRIVGPNCLGVIRPDLRLNASFAPEMPASGNLAFVSQSGAICTAVLDIAFRERFGFSQFVSVGSMLDVDFGDIIDYLGNDHATRSILLYLESLTNFRKFMSAARSVSRVKPIIVLKSGRSAAGARAAASHTGAMAGEDAVYDAAFKRAGIVRVDTIGELFDCAELTAKQPRPSGPRLAIVTNGGGPGVMAADTLARHHREPAVLAAGTVEKLDALLPPHWSRGNPVDILGDASPERFRDVLDVCLHAAEIDAVLVVLAPQALADPEAVARILVASTAGRRYPLYACWLGGRSVERGADVLNAAGVPTYETPERAVRAFLYMHAYAAGLETLREIPPKLSGNVACDREAAGGLIHAAPTGAFMPESAARAVLAAYGMPLVRTETATGEAEAAAWGKVMGYPLAMKLLSPDISHKSEAGGVRLDLRSEAELAGAFRGIFASAQAYRPGARIEGVTLQPYLGNPDYEVLLGARRDANFGPVILFGMGGIFAEVLGDRALGLPPMNRLLAMRLMRETKVFSLLQGCRNRPPADLEKLQEMIIRLSQLLIDFPEIAELDMNPVFIKNGAAAVVDARILVSGAGPPSPAHLVISPYPQEYESRETTAGNIDIFVRPVKPEDAPLFTDLFRVLSPTSIYYRFFAFIKELRPEMLARFTQIDYDREIALVAIDRGAGPERMLGVARIVGDPDGKNGEFAVLVGDPWHGRGIGAVLLKKCLDIARIKGFETIVGLVLPENVNMLAFGRRMGFAVTKDSSTGDYELKLRLGAK